MLLILLIILLLIVALGGVAFNHLLWIFLIFILLALAFERRGNPW